MGIGAHTLGWSELLWLMNESHAWPWQAQVYMERAVPEGEAPPLWAPTGPHLGAQGSSHGCGAMDHGASLSAPGKCRALAFCSALSVPSRRSGLAP